MGDLHDIVNLYFIHIIWGYAKQLTVPRNCGHSFNQPINNNNTPSKSKPLITTQYDG